MHDVLLVAATDRELNGRDGLVCGVGPVEAAAGTARALAFHPVLAVLHIGVAGARGLDLGTLVIGEEARYCDVKAAIPVVEHAFPDHGLLEVAQRTLPDAQTLTIGTSAAVGATGAEMPVEAMEGFGVLRAAALAGVPALELRAVSNEVGESDRAAWRIGDALGALDRAVPLLLTAIATMLATDPRS